MITGKATIEKFNILTNELIEEPYEETNDICYPKFETLILSTMENTIKLPLKTPPIGSPQDYWFIAYGTKRFKQSMLNISFPYSEMVRTIIDYPTYETATLPMDKDKVVFVADILPPSAGTTRTIETLGVGTSINYSNEFIRSTLTNLQLTTPCIQNDSTVVRVTYRIFFDNMVYNKPVKNVNQHLLERIKFMLRNQLNEQASPTAYPKMGLRVSNTIFTPDLMIDSNPNVVFKNLAPISVSNYPANKYFSDRGIYLDTLGSNLLRYNSTLNIPNRNITSNDIPSFGCMLKSLYIASDSGNGNFSETNNNTFSYRNVYEDLTPLQNIFKLKNTAVGPFQDISNIGTMLGGITVDVSNYDNHPLPKLFRIKITQSGDINTAQYKYEELSFNAGFINNTYCPRVAVIPQDPMNSENSNYFRKKENDKISIPSLDIASGICTIRSPDKERFVAIADCTRVNNFISIYDVITGNKWIVDSTYNLNVTNVSDLAVSNGKIYVTCSATGVWEINWDPYNTLTTVTHLTIDSFDINTPAYQIDVKADGSLIILMEGGLVKSNTLVTTWTTYNTLTATQFSATGISDNNWSNVAGMTVDPDNVNDRILFLLGNTTGNGYVWWSRGGSTTGSDFISPTTVPSISGYTKILTNMLKRSDSIRCVNGRWLEFTGIYTMTSGTLPLYNYSWTSTNLNTTSVTYTTKTRSMTPIPAKVNNINGIFIGSGTSSRGTTFFIRDTALPTLSSDFSYTSSNIEFFTRFGSNGLSTDLRLYNGSSSSILGWNEVPLIYLENSNLILFYEPLVKGFSVMPLVIDPSITNYNTFKGACWKEYGWNSGTSNWELNNPNSRQVNSSLLELNNGIEIAFNENVGTGTQFLSTERFEFIVGKGLMKDNATSYTFSFNISMYPNELITTFDNNLITQPGLLTDEPLTFSSRTPNNSIARTYLLQNKGLITGTSSYNSDTELLVSEQVIPSNSNFNLSFRFSNLSITNQPYYFAISSFSSGTSFTGILHLRLDSNNNLVVYSSNNSTVLFTSTEVIDIDTDIGISRSTTINANKLSISINGTEKFVTTTTHSETLYPIINLDTSTNTGTLGFNNCKITYTENRYIVRVGDSLLTTGSFNNKFMTLGTSANLNEVKINVGNIPFTPISTHSAGTIGVTEFNIASGCGWLVFSTNHVGTVSGSAVVYYTPDYV